MDQRINDRGILVDSLLVHRAIECNQILSDWMTKEACRITGLENPNSISQLKKWLKERDVPIPSLTKKAVATAILELDRDQTDPDAVKMLKLRSQMARSSVKKY